MLHCITTCCGSTLMRSEIHIKHSSPTQSLCNHVPWALQEVSQSRLHAGGSWSLDQGQAPALLQHWACWKGLLGIDPSMPISSPRWAFGAAGLWARGLRHAGNCLHVPCALPQASCVGQTKPWKTYKNTLAICIKARLCTEKSYILFHKHRHLQLIKVAAYNYTLSY